MDEFDAFSDVVETPPVPAAMPASQPVANGFDAIGEVAPAPQPVANEFDAIGEVAPANAVQQNELQFEIEQMLRRGATPDAVRRYIGTVRSAETGGGIVLPKPTQIEAAADYYRRGGTDPIQWEVTRVAPDAEGNYTPSSDLGATARGFFDVMLFNWADEAQAFIETGALSGPEYEAAWQRQQQRRQADDPNLRMLGQAGGIAGQFAAPAGALGRVAGLGRQMLAGAGIGAGMSALAGAGAQEPDQRLDTVDQDAVLGAGFGAVAPPLAAGARRVVQQFGKRPETAAADYIQSAGLDPADLMQRAEQYSRSTGKGPRLADILTPEEARRFTRPLEGSQVGRVARELDTARTTLPEEMADRLVRTPNATPNALSANPDAGPIPGRRPVVGPEELKRRASDLANAEFGAIRDTPVDISGMHQVIAEDILPYVSLPKLTRDRLRNALDNGQPLTVGDFDTIRRALGKNPQVPGARDYKDLADEVNQFVSNQVPEYGVAVRNFARRNAVADGGNPGYVGGANLGRQAASPGASTTDTLAAIARQSPEGATGVTLGARSGLYDDSLSQSYSLATRAANDPGFRERIVAAMPGGEGEAFLNYAASQKQAIDALAALARVPPDKIETVLNSTEDMVDILSGFGFGGGGAFKAAIVNNLLARTPIGRAAAEKLADDLFDPKKLPRVLDILEKSGMPRRGVRELVQGVFLSAGTTLLTGDRVPEGVPPSPEASMMGVPQ